MNKLEGSIWNALLVAKMTVAGLRTLPEGRQRAIVTYDIIIWVGRMYDLVVYFSSYCKITLCAKLPLLSNSVTCVLFAKCLQESLQTG